MTTVRSGRMGEIVLMGYWTSFLEGFTRGSAVSVVLALGIALGGFAAAVAFIDERFVASRIGRDLLSSGRADDDLEVTSSLLGLSGRNPGRPLIVIVGASETREMINLARFEAAVSGSGGESVDTVLLAQPRQGLSEVGRIADRIPDGTSGVFVLSLGIGRFVTGEGEGNQGSARLGFRSDREDAASHGTGMSPRSWCGAFLLENLDFYAPRLMRLPRNLAIGPPERSVYRYDRRRPMPDEEWRLKGAEIQSRLEGFDSNFTVNAEKLSAIIRRLRERTRMSLVVTVFPVNPRFVNEFIGKERYRAMVSRVLKTMEAEGLPVADLEQARLLDSDYWDWLHLCSPDGRARTTDILAETVRGVLPNHGGSN